MAPVPFLIAFAVAGGHVTFAGAVATPTAASAPVITQPSSQPTSTVVTQLGRFDDPPRVVSIQPLDSAEDRSEIVVKYL